MVSGLGFGVQGFAKIETNMHSKLRLVTGRVEITAQSVGRSEIRFR